MEKFLYHILLPENHQCYVSVEEIKENGIDAATKSNNWYTCGGKVNLVITNNLKPFGVPNWVDFSKAIITDTIQIHTESFYFPVFTDKILVFNGEISSLIYDQAFYDDNKYMFEEASGFDTGKNIDQLIKEYWYSMNTLEKYILNKPYGKPEIIIFEPIPKEIIQVSSKQ